MNGKTQSNDVNTRMPEMLELFDKDFKIAIIKSLQYTITNSFETNREKKTEKSHEIKSYFKRTNRNYKTEK